MPWTLETNGQRISILLYRKVPSSPFFSVSWFITDRFGGPLLQQMAAPFWRLMCPLWRIQDSIILFIIIKIV